MPKKFKKNNETFKCLNCGVQVPEHPKSSRDHCIKCLFGLHVDINPGDRLNSCKGMLTPIGIEVKGQTERIVYQCVKCGNKVKCVVAPDDNRDEIMKLYKKIWG